MFTTVSTNWLWVHPHSDWPTPTSSEGNNLLFFMSTPTDREATTSLASTNLPKFCPSSLLCLIGSDHWNPQLCSSLSSIFWHWQRQSLILHLSSFYTLEGISSLKQVCLFIEETYLSISFTTTNFYDCNINRGS